MAGVEIIVGVERRHADRLRRLGIQTVGALLARAATPSARVELADQIRVTPAVVRDWAARADLMRIRGVGPEYAQLLLEAGITSVSDLAYQTSLKLTAALVQAANGGSAARRVPAISLLERWIAQAAELSPLVSDD